MNPRSILRVRERPHVDPKRAGETIIEVVRDGEVAATIYGSREGIHINSTRLAPGTNNTPFRLNLPSTPTLYVEHGFIVPLLAPGEPCPWCELGTLGAGFGCVPCPVCNPEVIEAGL